jgi:hypothetical protein
MQTRAKQYPTSDDGIEERKRRPRRNSEEIQINASRPDKSEESRRIEERKH